MKDTYENHIDVYGYGTIIDRGGDRVELRTSFATDPADDEFTIGVNGHTTRVKRGATVMITRSAAEALMISANQAKHAAEVARGLSH